MREHQGLPVGRGRLAHQERRVSSERMVQHRRQIPERGHILRPQLGGGPAPFEAKGFVAGPGRQGPRSPRVRRAHLLILLKPLDHVVVYVAADRGDPTQQGETPSWIGAAVDQVANYEDRVHVLGLDVPKHRL